MGGFFGTIKKKSCLWDLYYGTDYNSHLGTKRGGMAMYAKEIGFTRSIHNLESSYFRTKFEQNLPKFKGNAGIGVISDTDAQPILMNSHLGRFAIVTIACINNIEELGKELLNKKMTFSEMSSGKINQSELVALLISEADSFTEGIENVYRKVKGSCTMLLLTENELIAARDKLGRLPMTIAKHEDGYAVSCESCSFHNLDYEPCYNLGPGEIVRITPDSYEQLRKPEKKMQICSFLWVYYGYPASSYEGRNVEMSRYRSGSFLARRNPVEADAVAGVPDSGTSHALGYALADAEAHSCALYKLVELDKAVENDILLVFWYAYARVAAIDV